MNNFASFDPTMELLCKGRFQKRMLAMAVYGYARVSTRDQTLASQEAQLRAAACTKIYAEKVSGAWGDRPELAKLLKRLDQGDVLIVTRLDRLARSIRDGLLMAKRKQTWLGASTYRKQ